MKNTGTTASEAKKWIGYTVRVYGHERRQHKMPAKLISVNERTGTAMVKPSGHYKAEEVPLTDIALWKSRAPAHLLGGIDAVGAAPSHPVNPVAVAIDYGAGTTTPLPEIERAARSIVASMSDMEDIEPVTPKGVKVSPPGASLFDRGPSLSAILTQIDAAAAIGATVDKLRMVWA